MRLDDLPALIDDLVRRGEAEGRPSITFTQTALDCLAGYAWPGNVRELQNLDRAARDSVSEPDDRPRAATDPDRRAAPSAATDDHRRYPQTGLDLREHLGNIEKQLIRSALDQTDGTVAHAARLLNLRRTTLVEKLRKYELHAHAHA